MRSKRERAVDQLDAMADDERERKLYASEGVIHLKVFEGGESYMSENTIQIFTAHG